MKFLLDTQIFIWAYSRSNRLPSSFVEVLQNQEHELAVSVVTMWEMAIKEQIKKLSLPLPAKQFVAQAQSDNQLQIVPVVENHIWQVRELPLHHRDPFDRLLIAQAIVEDLVMLTTDPVFKHYPVKLYQ